MQKYLNKTGVKAIMIVLLALVAVTATKPAVETVFATYHATGGAQTRKLPIYSVDIPDKKIAISFDAAWGA